MRFSKKIVVLMFATMITFTCVMVVTYWHKGGIPDALIEPFFSFFGIEGGALGIIKVSETLADRFDKKEKPTKKPAKK